VDWHDLRQRIEDRESRIEPQVNPRSSILDLQSLEVGRRALARCFSEIEHRLKRFDEELMHLRRGYYAPEIRAASLLLQQATGESPITPIPHLIPLPLSILVVVEPSAAGIPHPHVSHGRLLEAFVPLSDSSRSALEGALRIRDQAIAPSVTIQVVAVGARGLASVLREALSLGADRVCLIQLDCEAVAPGSAAAALGAVRGPYPGFGLILGGEAQDDHEEGLSAR